MVSLEIPCSSTTDSPSVSMEASRERLNENEQVRTFRLEPIAEIKLEIQLLCSTLENQPIHYPRSLAPAIRPYFALYTPSHFSLKRWEKMWNEPTLILDLYVSSNNPTTSDQKSPATSTTYFYPEEEFMGIPYRVKFDQSRCDKPVHIKTGNAVDILRTNTFYGRYIVDSCQLIRNGQAYLAIHFRNYDRQGFTSTIDPRHPSFILEIPQSFCQTSMMQHLPPWPTAVPRPILTNAQLLELFLKTE